MTFTRKVVLSAGILVLLVSGVGAMAAAGRGADRLILAQKSALKLLNTKPLKLPIANLLPGDTVTRRLALQNLGTKPATLVRLNIALAKGQRTTLLTSDRVNGVKIGLERCSTLWRKRGTTYVCNGVRTVLLKPRRLTMKGMRLPGLTGLKPKERAYIKMTISLPPGADNRFQHLATQITYKFTMFGAS